MILQQSLADLNTAYRNFFASVTGERKGPKVEPPRFKSRKDRRQAVRFTANARFKILASGRLRLPKIGDVEVRWSRDLPSAPASVTVIKDAAGRYFASFVAETGPAADAARFPAPHTGAEVGIDLGLTSFAVLSDGTVVRSPRFLRRAERKLRRLQKSLSRKAEGSSNREKARVRVARAHAKVADSRRDFHHKTSTAIIRDNQAVYAEDLCVSGLARTRMAKSVHDAGWSAFVTMLEYKARRYSRSFGKIGRLVPSTQLCSACGVNGGKKPLRIREWTCPACGTVHDRDLNAAKNILALGRRERLNACGDGVRPLHGGRLSVKQEPSEVSRERHGRNPRASRPGRMSKLLPARGRRDLPYLLGSTAGAPSMSGNAYTFLDLTALGRQEDWEDPKGRVAPVRGGDPTFTS